MALLVPQEVALTGLAPTYTAVNATDTFPTGDRYYLHVKTAGTINTVTLVSPSGASCSFGVAGTAHNDVITTLATGEKIIGPLRTDRFMDPTTGVGSVTYSPQTTCTAALIHLPAS